MLLRATRRVKDGKEHRYWSIVENRRGVRRRVVQRQVLYLGEINDSQKAAWCRCIEVFEAPRGERRQVALFPVKRQFVCKRWTIGRADESSNGTPWSAKHKLNSDRSRFRLRSLPSLGFDV